MGFCDYVLGMDTHNVQFADKSNFKKPCSTCSPYLGQHLPGLSNSFGLGLYLGTYKALITKILKDKLVYKNFSSILQYTIKSKETRIKKLNKGSRDCKETSN